MKNSNLRGSIILFMAALLWGSTFIMQRKAALFVGPFTFLFFRSIIAVVLLFILSKITEKRISVLTCLDKKKIIIFACMAGVSLFFASAFQQIGLETISASKSGFITSMYMILVPIIGLFFKEKIKPYLWAFVLIAIIGSYLLSTTSGLSFGFGELITLLGALFFAFQIIFVDKTSKFINPYKFCMIQIAIVAILSFIMMLIFEEVSFINIKKAFWFMVYAGVISSCIAYSFQMLGQKYAEPTIASIVMSLESVFALIFGFIFLNELMGEREVIGSILIFLSVICSQIPFEKIFLKNNN